MIGDGAEVAAGTPLIAGASVAATVVEQTRATKIIVFKKKRRHNYRRKKGHRQQRPSCVSPRSEARAVRGTEEGVTDGA